MTKLVEDYSEDELKDVDFWRVAEFEDTPYISARTIDEAIEEYKAVVDDDPEEYFESAETWEAHKKNPEARITVTAFKQVKDPAGEAMDILDDVLLKMEENDFCFYENCYRSNPKLIEAAEQFKKAIEENIDPYYNAAFDVLAKLNSSNGEY